MEGKEKSGERRMDFQSLSRLNVLVNVLSGNLLPTTYEGRTPIVFKIYSFFVWSIEMIYVFASILGVFNVSREKALQNSTVNIVVSVEVILLVVHLHNRKNLLRGLIEKLNSVLTADNETLRNAVIKTVKPLEKPLRIYTIAAFSTVVIWTSMPLFQIFRMNVFTYEDYRIPVTLSKEPFSRSAFVVGVVFEVIGSGYTILKKTSLDVYMMHLILLMTAQYRYLKVKLVEILRNESAMECRQDSEKLHDVTREEEYREEGRLVQEKLNLLVEHHVTVTQINVMLRKLLTPNIGILYINSVFRFCFLGLMLIMNSSMSFETYVIIMYTIGAFMQLYILCYCVQQLFEASTMVSDDAFHEKWYAYDTPIQRTFAIIILSKKLECRLSSFRNIDLTLPSFVSILNQAYSVCLLFMKVK